MEKYARVVHAYLLGDHADYHLYEALGLLEAYHAAGGVLYDKAVIDLAARLHPA